MNYIDILPQIRNNIFYVRVVMTDYDVENQMVIRIVARRNDGLYKTEVVQYPNEGTDYNGEIIVPMFGMAKSLVAQIVGVKINGTEVRVNSTEVEGADITARYDDSLTRMGWEESMNNIHLDFEVVSTNNPKTLRIAVPQFFSVFSEGERWCRLMECQNVADLNGLTASGRIRELIRVNEALHEKRFAQVADLVCSRGAQVVLLAGPSSSGKTTSANRLAVQLRVYGKKPVLMSLDDYYIDRDRIAPGPDGKLDLEHINTLDCELFRKDIAALIAGRTVELPTFNFKTGRREWKGKKLGLEKDSVIIAEGLHALNPVMLPENVDMARIFRLYVSPLLPLNLDDHNRIPTSYLRLLRRIVRDYETRGASVQHTLSMWESVQQGEKRWIFPFQENADMIFNSSTLYELAVLKKHIYPLLAAVQPEESCYDEVQYIVKILDYIQEANVDDEIPPTSLIREFIGGNTFYR